MVSSTTTPSWLQGDPELAASREKLILRMVGFRPWSEASLVGKLWQPIRFTLGGAGLGLALFIALAFVFSFVLSATDPLQCADRFQGWTEPTSRLRHECEGFTFDIAFRWAFRISAAIAAMSILMLEYTIVRKWKRLRHLPNKAFLEEYDAWEERKARWGAMEERDAQRDDARRNARLDAQEFAQAVGRETLRAGRQLEYEVRTRNYQSF